MSKRIGAIFLREAATGFDFLFRTQFLSQFYSFFHFSLFWFLRFCIFASCSLFTFFFSFIIIQFTSLFSISIYFIFHIETFYFLSLLSSSWLVHFFLFFLLFSYLVYFFFFSPHLLDVSFTYPFSYSIDVHN